MLACVALTACTQPVQEAALTRVTTPSAAPVPVQTTAVPAVPRPLVFGGDISWPSCPIGTIGALPERPGKGLPLPGPAAQFVVIGLTNGPGFYPNPCLAWEVEQARNRHLWTAAYAFTTLPSAAQIARYGGSGPYPANTVLGRLRNASDAQARINVESIRRTRLKTPIVWMDVEPQNYLAPWGSDITVNRAVLIAARTAYRRAGFATGFYSSATPWRKIAGGLRDTGPTWVTAGPRGRAAAEAMCTKPSWSGGTPVLAQYWPDDTQDFDVTCAPARDHPEKYFAR